MILRTAGLMDGCFFRRLLLLTAGPMHSCLFPRLLLLTAGPMHSCFCARPPMSSAGLRKLPKHRHDSRATTANRTHGRKRCDPIPPRAERRCCQPGSDPSATALWSKPNPSRVQPSYIGFRRGQQCSGHHNSRHRRSMYDPGSAHCRRMPQCAGKVLRHSRSRTEVLRKAGLPVPAGRWWRIGPGHLTVVSW